MSKKSATERARNRGRGNYQSHKGDLDKTLEILNDALATEIDCVLRYMQHYFMATGVLRPEEGPQDD